MAQISKTGIIGIILASLVVIASLVFLGCVLKHQNYGHGHGHHGGSHGEEHHSVMHSSQMDEAGEGLVIEYGYARANGASAKAGAAFMVIKNYTDDADRLIAVTTTAARKTELHTHIMDANGVMMMREVKAGFEVPAHSAISLKRGGNHIMMMGLTQPMIQGDVVTLSLTFENAGEVSVEIPVDLQR